MFGLGGGIIGFFVGPLCGEPTEDPDEIDSRMNAGFLIGSGSGLALGLSAVLLGGPATTTQKIPTGRTKTEYYHIRKDLEFLNESLIYQNNPAKNIDVMISKSYKQGIMKTDYRGLVGIDRETAKFFGISWSPSKETIKRNMSYFNPLVKQIKLNALEKIRSELEENISSKNFEFTLKTIEKPSSSEKIENDSKRILLKGYYLPNEAIYEAVRNFVNEKINSHIKTLEFSVKDIITHVPIDGSNFTIKTEVPSKSYLAGEFFTGKLKNYAENNTRNYITGNTLIENCDRIIKFNVYVPSRIFVEVTHPDYNFVSGEIFVNDNMKKTVYMLDKGTKIRIEEESKKGGRIE